MRRYVIDLRISRPHGREPCVTTIRAAGGYVVVVESVVSDSEVLVVSSYLAELSGRTAASHLALVGCAPAAFSQRLIERLAGQTHSRACLLDHAAVLRDVLASRDDDPVSVAVSEAALAEATAVWGNVDVAGAAS